MKRTANYDNRHRVNRRDDFICALCFRSVTATRYLRTHHIDLDPRNGDPRNLITLCAKCHRMIHHADEDEALRYRSMLTEIAVIREVIYAEIERNRPPRGPALVSFRANSGQMVSLLIEH